MIQYENDYIVEDIEKPKDISMDEENGGP